ncbi:hypothetical protein [Pseudooceanicola sp. LIPI14-2-Ac024]|uniref:hypothetical protein n=1 Tax=Pseudooceanicola sp. LIPI14-2-Ac024 TaxID=3344875 RepID=UPI0035CEABCE
MKRIGRVTPVLAVAVAVVSAGAVMAQDARTGRAVAPATDEVGRVVGQVTQADRVEVVPTRSVYDPYEAYMIGQPTVRQYVFERDASADTLGGNPKDEAARLR